MKYCRFISIVLAVVLFAPVFGQEKEKKQITVFHQQAFDFDRHDTLRGSITPEREWWDLVYYDLKVDVDIDNQTISGQNTIQYRVLDAGSIMQIDLQEPMKITAIRQDGKQVAFKRDGNAWFVKLNNQLAGELTKIEVSFEGKPRRAKRAPWDGGFSWDQDEDGNPFIATANQGLGASAWWPCKDHPYDEPDSMDMRFTVPSSLMAVGNGRLVGSEENGNGKKTWHWKVRNPINHYGVNLNIGRYAHFAEVYNGEKGPLSCDYYVLERNLEKAKKQFKQVPMMLEAFEYWFGPYPFYEDGYKLVEVPYLGMEHQSSVTYGNKYQNGYLGRDLSGTGQGLKFDFIIIHESGHEWFANSITYNDVADMWVHEGFTQYSEGLYLEYHFGKEAGYEYLEGLRRNIRNDIPIIGVYDVNQEGSGDMYAKGANLLHMIRQLVDDDDTWRDLLRGINKDFYHQTVSSKQVEDYIIDRTGLDLQPVFDQYLRNVEIPVLVYALEEGVLRYRWDNCIEGFDMPVRVKLARDSGSGDSSQQKTAWLYPTAEWQQMPLNATIDSLSVDPAFYVFHEMVDQ